MHLAWTEEIREQDQLAKTAFAEELLRKPDEPLRCAIALFGQTDRVHIIAKTWPADAFVLAEKQRLLLEKGEEYFLPSKIEVARSIWDRAQQTTSASDYETLTRLYCDVRGFTGKAAKVEVNTGDTIINHNVMVVPVSSSNEEWEKTIEMQQTLLLSEAVDG